MSSSTTPIDPLARIEAHITLTEKEILCAEEEIRRRITFLSNLRAERNSFLPVFHLPPETLAIIFIHGARDHYESDGGSFATRIPTWVNVSYVCRHWRDIALNLPTLWTYHFNVSLRWTQELLLRSREALLKISCFSRQFERLSWGRSFVDSLLKHSERIQELHLDLPSSFLLRGLTLRAPRLEKLHLECISMQSITITDGDKLPLHTLKLVDCVVPWYSLNLTGLKTLFLRDVYSPSPLNMVEVLAILSSMRNLTVLHLERVLSSAREFLSSGGLDTSPKINLPCLALLVVIEPLSTVVALLSCVNIPQRTQVSLGLLLELRSTIDDFTPICSFLAQQFGQQSSGLIFRSLFFDASPFFSLAFGLESAAPSPLKEVGYNIPLVITFEMDVREMVLTHDDVHRMMVDICSSLPLRNIQGLHIRCRPFLPHFWRDLLGCLDGLRHMKLSDGCIPDLSLLTLPARKSNENPVGQLIPDQDPTLGHMFVPALEELEFHRVTFALDHTSRSDDGMSRKSLFDALSTRQGLRDRLTMTGFFK